MKIDVLHNCGVKVAGLAYSSPSTIASTNPS